MSGMLEILIVFHFIVFAVYFVWLLAFVYKFDISDFFSFRSKVSVKEKKVTKNMKIEGVIKKSHTRFIEKMPEFNKPYWEEPLPLQEKNKPEIMPVEEIKDGYLSEEEQKEILDSQAEAVYWEDDFSNEFNQPGTLHDFLEAADVIFGKKSSEADLIKTEETLKYAPEGLLELFALHAVNEERVKIMLEESLGNLRNREKCNAKMMRQLIKDFIVEDYISH